MSKVFYFSEIVKFAIEKEIESYNLYRELEGLSTVETTKKLFQDLMREEQKHERFYENMLSSVKNEQSPGTTEDEEYRAYMQALIDSSREIPPITNLQLQKMPIALEYAIAREKDSILFYVGLKNFLPDSERSMIDSIIAEEGRHMYRLFNLKLHLKG